MYKLRTRACTDWNQLIASIPANLLDSTVAYAENCGPNRLAGIEVSFGTEPKPPQKQGLHRPVFCPIMEGMRWLSTRLPPPIRGRREFSSLRSRRSHAFARRSPDEGAARRLTKHSTHSAA